jgi:hypothetical protein
MKHIIYCMQFKGTGTPGGESGVLKATTSATSCDVRTVVGANGVEGQFHPAEGGMAYFESEVRMLPSQDSFLENGTITFGESGHGLKFSTVGHGHLGPTPDPKLMAGVVNWKIEGGEGQFAEASGFITSNFTLTTDGQVTDYHFGHIFVK